MDRNPARRRCYSSLVKWQHKHEDGEKSHCTFKNQSGKDSESNTAEIKTGRKKPVTPEKVYRAHPEQQRTLWSPVSFVRVRKPLSSFSQLSARPSCARQGGDPKAALPYPPISLWEEAKGPCPRNLLQDRGVPPPQTDRPHTAPPPTLTSQQCPAPHRRRHPAGVLSQLPTIPALMSVSLRWVLSMLPMLTSND